MTAFFASLASEKQKVVAPYAGYPYGWLGPQQEALAASKGEKTPPDLKESFDGSPLDIPKNILDPRAYEFRINRPCGRTLVVFKERGGPIMMQSKIFPTASWLL